MLEKYGGPLSMRMLTKEPHQFPRSDAGARQYIDPRRRNHLMRYWLSF